MKTNLSLIRPALECRKVEERLLALFKQGLLSGTVHTSIGQEIIPIIVQRYLHDNDYKFSNHRGHSHYLAATGDVKGLIKELLGKVDGCSGGYGGSQHLYSKEYNFYSNGIQGGMAPIAAGVAMGLKKEAAGRIACIYIGDGTLGQGVLYEALNICGIFGLPVLFICEDNGVAQSTMTSAFKLDVLGKRVEGFSCVYKYAESDDWESLDKVAGEAVKIVRQNKPVFLHVKTRRLKSHSKGDDNRPNDILADNDINDPLNKLLRSDSEVFKIAAEISDGLGELVEECLRSESLNHCQIYSYTTIEDYKLNKHEPKNLSVRKKIYNSLESILKNSGFVLGEDVRNKNGLFTKDYGGAFKITGDLSDAYPEAVINTPISEQALIGVGTGLSLTGRESSVEIMFGDFMTLTLDQVYQHISKFTVMFGATVGMPLVIRSPMGGRRGYGPTHSQSIERFFLGMPGVTVSYVNKYSPLEELLREGLSKKIPQILFEHKLCYSSTDVSCVEDTHSVFVTDDYSKTVIVTPKNRLPTLTVLTYGFGLDLVEDLIRQTDTEIEIVSPTVISPFNLLPLVKSLVKTGKLFILEEGFDSFGLSSAVVLELTKKKFNFELVGSAGNGSVIPAASVAELGLLNFGLETLKGWLKNA
jgi:2-oxoisovalerate dehydrogenase E1 component